MSTNTFDANIQPQALDYEKAVLGALMLEMDAFDAVENILKPESFYLKAHSTIFEAISKLQHEDKPIDLLTVKQALVEVDELESIGGEYYLAELSNYVSQAAHIEHHAEVILEKYVQREVIRTCSELQKEAFVEGANVRELLERCESSFFKLSQGNVKRELVPIDSLLDEAVGNVRKASEQEGDVTGVPSGFTELDRLTGGWQKTDLIIVAARPAMGKTAFALSMARNMAVRFNRKVAVFSLEMGNIQLVNRLIVAETEIPGEKIKKGKLNAHEWVQLETKIKPLQDAQIFVDDTAGMSVLELRTKSRRLKKEHGVDIIMIDYLQLMTAQGMRPGNRQEEVAIISRSLKGLAKELDIPIIALAQLNRGVEGRGSGLESKRPQLSDLRESGSIEQDADIVCFIHRPEYYGHTEDGEGNSLLGIGQVIIAKHRNGATDDVSLRFKAELIRFQNLEDDAIGISMGGTATLGSKMNVDELSNNFENDTNDSIEDGNINIIAPSAGDNQAPF